MKTSIALALAASFAVVPTATAAVDFVKEIQPILEVHCTKCHGEDQKKGGLRLHTLADTLKGGDSGMARACPPSSSAPPSHQRNEDAITLRIDRAGAR